MDDRIKRLMEQRVGEEGYALRAGMRLVDMAPGSAVVEMTPGPEDLNIFGMVHGGAIFSLADEAFQISCNSYGTIAVALSVNIIYHRPAERGVRLRAESRQISSSRRTATYDIKIYDLKPDPIASCQALAYRKGEPLPFLEG